MAIDSLIELDKYFRLQKGFKRIVYFHLRMYFFSMLADSFVNFLIMKVGRIINGWVKVAFAIDA